MHPKSIIRLVKTSVLHPNTLNLDPDPGFWANWIRIRIQGSTINYERKNEK